MTPEIDGGERNSDRIRADHLPEETGSHGRTNEGRFERIERCFPEQPTAPPNSWIRVLFNLNRRIGRQGEPCDRHSELRTVPSRLTERCGHPTTSRLGRFRSGLGLLLSRGLSGRLSLLFGLLLGRLLLIVQHTFAVCLEHRNFRTARMRLWPERRSRRLSSARRIRTKGGRPAPTARTLEMVASSMSLQDSTKYQVPAISPPGPQRTSREPLSAAPLRRDVTRSPDPERSGATDDPRALTSSSKH